MLRLALLVVALVCTLAVAACGEDDAQQAAPEGVSGEVSAIAEATKEAQRDIARAARNVTGDEQARDRAAAELQTLEDRARELAQRAESEIPEDDPVRDALRAANERLAAAAVDLRAAAQQAAGSIPEDAMRDLAAAQDRLQNTAATLADRAGEDARDLADRLRRELPEVAGP